LSRIEEIRARLEAATPGPWHMRKLIIRDRIYRWEIFAPHGSGYGGKPIAVLTDGFTTTDETAELIANAPADLLLLLAVTDAIDEEMVARCCPLCSGTYHHKGDCPMTPLVDATP